MITGIHHVSLRVSNFDRSLAFYRDALGLRQTVGFTLGERRFALLETGNSGYLELVETKTEIAPTGKTEVAWHFALRSTDIAGDLAKANAAGCPTTKEVTQLDLVNTVASKPFPIRIAFFKGFDGEEVELFEELA